MAKSFKAINTPVELLKFMDNINYGFVDEKGNVYDYSDDEKLEYGFTNIWKLSEPKRLIEVGYGNCFDQVELEREWFKNHNYNFKTFYIQFLLPYQNPYTTHTYLVYEDNGKWYYFEHSDISNRGIKEFSTLNDAINYQKEKHIEQNKNYGLTDEEQKSIHIFEYQNPGYNSSFEEFINYILDNYNSI